MKVYIIKNKINDLVYIGQTKGKLKYRFNKHIYSANVQNRTNKFHTAIRDLGSDNFFIESLCICNDQR